MQRMNTEVGKMKIYMQGNEYLTEIEQVRIKQSKSNEKKMWEGENNKGMAILRSVCV